MAKMKDPAALFYIDKYISATAEMDADCVGWYTKLILHQYDKKDLPNDIEKLAALCNVKFSEFKRFEKVFNDILKDKFLLNDNGRLEQQFAKEVIQKREKFTNKKSKSGTIGYIVKVFIQENLGDIYDLDKTKDFLYNLEEDELNQAKNKQTLKQMLKQNGKLYINEDEDVNKDINKGEIEIKKCFEMIIADKEWFGRLITGDKIKSIEDFTKWFDNVYLDGGVHFGSPKDIKLHFNNYLNKKPKEVSGYKSIRAQLKF